MSNTIYIASLLAMSITEIVVVARHTVTSCDADSEEEAHNKFLVKAIELYPIVEGHTNHDVVILAFGHNIVGSE